MECMNPKRKIKLSLLHYTIASLIFPSVMIWLVPFIISTFFYNSDGQLNANFLLFKVVMVAVSIITMYTVLRGYFEKYKTPWQLVAGIVFFINVFLDSIVLIGLFGLDILLYLASVLTVYVVLIPSMSYYMYMSCAE